MKPKPSLAPRTHPWLLGFAIASFVAWLLAPDEGYKMLAGLFTFLVLVIACFELVAHLFDWRPHKRMILFAAVASLGSCGGQMVLSGRDLDQIVADMAHFNCLEGRRIVRTGHGFGRDWVRTDQADKWLATVPSPLKFHDLYLVRNPGSDTYSLRVPMPDMPSAYAECRPDPKAPAYVSLI